MENSELKLIQDYFGKNNYLLFKDIKPFDFIAIKSCKNPYKSMFLMDKCFCVKYYSISGESRTIDLSTLPKEDISLMESIFNTSRLTNLGWIFYIEFLDNYIFLPFTQYDNFRKQNRVVVDIESIFDLTVFLNEDYRLQRRIVVATKSGNLILEKPVRKD